MSNRSKKSSKAKNKTEKNIFDAISAEDAFTILKILAEKDINIAKEIEQITKEYLSKVDLDEIALDVYYELDGLDVEELWDKSGSSRYGYVEPADQAWDMIEELLEPFLEKLRKYRKLSMNKEAKFYCMGILKGIYKYEKESTSEFKDWAVDIPGECFETVVNDWKKNCKNPKDIKEMDDFITKNILW
ncbi:hypothetical protein KAU33_05555 [Candidatus Dependentiae bacterium]|nr:hypothetical protein [Candidatus Dependentiae bacterium]